MDDYSSICQIQPSYGALPCLTPFHPDVALTAPRTSPLPTLRPRRSYCAVGTFEPAIEIWNLDVLDPLEPTATLGGYKGKEKKPGKK